MGFIEMKIDLVVNGVEVFTLLDEAAEVGELTPEMRLKINQYFSGVRQGEFKVGGRSGEAEMRALLIRSQREAAWEQ
jgi:hypothetical protein